MQAGRWSSLFCAMGKRAREKRSKPGAGRGVQPESGGSSQATALVGVQPAGTNGVGQDELTYRLWVAEVIRKTEEFQTTMANWLRDPKVQPMPMYKNAIEQLYDEVHALENKARALIEKEAISNAEAHGVRIVLFSLSVQFGNIKFSPGVR